MMMHYRKKNKRSYLLFFVAIFIILILGLINFRWPQVVARTLSNPIVTVKNVFTKPFSSVATTFKSKKALEERIIELEIELNKSKVSLISQNFVNSQIEDYNLELEKKSQGAISKVLNRPPFSPYDTLLILKGDNSIELGDLVFVHGLYIGDIASVDAYTATVKLRSSAGEKTLVRVGDVEVEALGKGGGQFTINIPKDLELKIGDAVMVPDLNYSLIGSVGQIKQDPVATFKTVYFSIPIAFQDMNFVSVVKKDSVLE
jgi:cell shape-determining protein MreC